MFDIKRIRERAADWLGDVGSAALLVAGDVLGAVGSAVRGSPHEEAFERDDETDDELRARVKATRARSERPWNSCPKCGARVDIDEDDSDGSEVRCISCDTYLILNQLSDDSWALRNPDDDREELHDKGTDVRLIIKPDADPAEVLAACARLLDIEPAGTSPPVGQDPAPHPPGGVQPVDSDAPPDTRTLEEREAALNRDVRAPLNAFLVWADSPRGQRYVGDTSWRGIARGAFLAGWRAREEQGAKPGVDRPELNDSERLGSKLAPEPITPPGDASGPPVEKASPAPSDADPTPPVKEVHPMGGDGGHGVDRDQARRVDASYSALYDLGVGPARALRCAEMAEEEAAGADPERWHRVLVDLVRTVGPDGFAAFESASAVESFRTMLRDAASLGEPTGTCSCPECGRGPVRFGGRCDRCGSKLEADVKPPHNAAPGALGEAREVGVCSRIGCEGGEMLRTMGRPCPCGAELRPVGFTTPPDPFVIITPEAAAGPSKVGGAYAEAMGAPRGCLCTWEARWDRGAFRGVERRGPGVMPCPVHLEAKPRLITPADLGLVPPANLCAIATEATRATADRATPPVASAAERVPESPSGGAGAPWRGIVHGVAHDPDWAPLLCWRASPDLESADPETPHTLFFGKHAEARAREYAELMSEPRAVDPRLVHRARAKLNVLAAVVDPNETPDGALNKPRHEIARRLILEAEQALDAALGIPVEPEDVEAHIAAQERAAFAGSGAPPALPKPSRVEVGQRWRCVGVDGEPVVARIDSGWDGPERAAFIGGNLGSARTADMLGLREWSYVGGAK